MALDVGLERHQEFLRRVGLFDRLMTELPESAKPLLPERWGKLATATAAFGHGFAVQPLQGASVVAGLLNGGMLITPTFLKRDRQRPRRGPADRQAGNQREDALSFPAQCDRRHGLARPMSIGYRVGGKTGTAEKVDQRPLHARTIADLLHRRLPDGRRRAMSCSSCSTSRRRRPRPMALPRRAGMRCRRRARSSRGLRRARRRAGLHGR